MPDLTKLISLADLQRFFSNWPSWSKASTKPDYSYSEIQNTPTLGTAASKDVAASGDASSSQVVMGDDSRLTDSRTPTAHASDLVTSLTGYSTAKAATSAIPISDNDGLNTALGKLEKDSELNQTNILSVEDMICDTEFSTSTAYAVGDIVTYEHGLYEFTSAHSAGAWNSAEVTEVNVVDKIGSGGGQTIKQDGVTGATVNRFGTCSTSASTAAKTVSITTGTFTLEAGARVTVKFSNANTAGTPTLNVDSTGAKNIYSKGSQITTGDNKALLAGTVDFIYDGSQYHLIGNYIGGSSAVTGVKGSNESSYRTGDVSLSYSNVGAAAASHTHSGYASSSHTHSNYLVTAYYTPNKTSGSLNSLSEGRVYCSSNCTNMPVSANMFVETLLDYNGSYYAQRAEVISGTYAGHVFTRYYDGSSWSSWIDLTLNTPITLATSGNISSASIDLSSILTGTYLFTVTNNESGTNRYGCSLYVLQKFDSGTVYVMKPVSETTYAKLSSYSFSGNTMSLSFDKNGYKTLRLICLYR